jgi:hypothetical protein
MTDYPDRPGYSFDPGPPPEASRFLKNKGMRPAFSWLDVEPEEHAVAFTVAKMTELDLLEAARAEVQKALDDGLPFKTFQKNWRANPALADWWGKKAMTDPLTGEVVEAQLGSPRRLRTIYDANLRSARAAGQWERIERTKAAFPYLEYTLGASERHRPLHVEKAGLILPVDSPFWDEWFPPNGWGCKCGVRPVTKREAERRGISTTPDIRDTKVVNKRTGEVAIVPVGIDPGWQRNPGKLRRQGVEGLLRDRLEAAPEAVVQAAVKDIARSWAAERVLEGTSPGAVPVAVLPASLAKAVGSATRIVRTTSEYGTKFTENGRGVTVETLALMNDALATGTVFIDSRKGQPEVIALSGGKARWVFIVKVLSDLGEIWVKSMYPLKPKKLRDLRATEGITVFRE